MDGLLQEYLPLAYNIYNQYYQPYSAYLAPIRAAFLHYQSFFFRFVYPSIFPFWKLANYFIRKLVLNITNSSAASPSTDALVSFIALAVVFFLSLKIFNFVRRQVMWWISLVTTLVTWGAMALSAWYVYNRGVEGSVEDIAYVAGLLMGWTQEGNVQGGRLASEREWDAERIRRQNAGRGRSAGKRTRGGG